MKNLINFVILLQNKKQQDEAEFIMRDAPIKDFFVCENAGVVSHNVFMIFWLVALGGVDCRAIRQVL